jgi:hypothetical protein
MRHNQYKFDRNWTLKKGTLLSKRKQVFLIYISPCNADAWLKHHTGHSVTTHQDHCKFTRNRAAKMGTSFLRPKEFLVPVSPHICSGGLKHYSWHSLDMLHNQCKFGRCRAVILYSWGQNSFSSRSCLALQRRDSNMRHGTLCACATSSTSYVEICQ